MQEADKLLQLRSSILASQERLHWEHALSSLLPKGKALRILDAGAGTGFLALILTELGHDVIGVDKSPAMVQCAYEAASAAGRRLEYRVMDCAHMDFDDESFDAVVSCELFSQLATPKDVQAELRRVLKPKGHIVIIDSAIISVEQMKIQGFSHCHIQHLPDIRAIIPTEQLQAMTAMKSAKSDSHILPQTILFKQYLSSVKKQIQLYQSYCQKADLAYPDYTVLNMLSFHPSGSRPTDIASALAIMPQTLTRILANMLKLGYVNRQTHESDRRSSVITITNAGIAKIKPLQSALQSIEEKGLAEFSIDEMTILSEISSKLLDNLSAEFKKLAKG